MFAQLTSLRPLLTIKEVIMMCLNISRISEASVQFAVLMIHAGSKLCVSTRMDLGKLKWSRGATIELLIRIFCGTESMSCRHPSVLLTWQHEAAVHEHLWWWRRPMGRNCRLKSILSATCISTKYSCLNLYHSTVK